MTDTTEATAGTALSQVAPGALALAKGHAPWTVADLADKLAGPAKELPQDAPFPKPAKPVTITDGLKKALTALPRVFGKVMPTERRKLEQAELSDLTIEALTIAAIATPLGNRFEAIKETIRTHMDVFAEAEKIVGPDTVRVAEGIAEGHYLLARPGDPFEIPVDGLEDAWQQRYVSGKASPKPALLLDLYDDGKITRKEYLAMTREERVYDPEKVASFIRKNPGRGLEILGAITTRSAPSASLYPPKK